MLTCVVYAHKGPTKEIINYSILFDSNHSKKQMTLHQIVCLRILRSGIRK